MTPEQAISVLKEAIGTDQSPAERMARAIHSGLPPGEFFKRELFALQDKVLVVIGGLEGGTRTGPRRTSTGILNPMS